MIDIIIEGIIISLVPALAIIAYKYPDLFETITSMCKVALTIMFSVWAGITLELIHFISASWDSGAPKPVIKMITHDIHFVINSALILLSFTVYIYFIY
jgi:hypothetical protein